MTAHAFKASKREVEVQVERERERRQGACPGRNG